MNKTEKLLAKLDPKTRKAILAALRLIYTGKLERLDTKALKGHRNTYRVRVGELRIIFMLNDDKSVKKIQIGRRNEKTYKNL